MFGKFPFGWPWFGFGTPAPEDEEEEEQPQPGMVVGTIYRYRNWPVTVRARRQTLILKAGIASAHGAARAEAKVGQASSLAFHSVGRAPSALSPSCASARGAARAYAMAQAMQLSSAGHACARGSAIVRASCRRVMLARGTPARPIGIHNPSEEEIMTLFLALE